MEDQLDTIRALYFQESCAYVLCEPVAFESAGLESRRKMLKFFYDLSHEIQGSQETVEIAMDHLDRFLASGTGSAAFEDKKMFQLSSCTCLYMAVKAHEHFSLTPTFIAQLSNGAFTAGDVESMELIIAKALEWRLNPPTCLSFLRLYLDLMPSRIITGDLKKSVYNLAKTQIKFSIEHPTLFCKKKSLVAYAAILNSSGRLRLKNLSNWKCAVEAVLGIHPSSASFVEMQISLDTVLPRNFGIAAPSHGQSASGKEIFASSVPEGPYDMSPRCVNNGVA